MTATANFRQMAQHIGLAICGLMMRTAFGVFGILWGYHQRDCKRSVRVAIGVIVAILSTIAFFGFILWLFTPLTPLPTWQRETARRQRSSADITRWDNIFVYMVEATYINGNFETFRRLYHELNKDARRDFMDFLLSEVEPTYWRERY